VKRQTHRDDVLSGESLQHLPFRRINLRSSARSADLAVDLFQADEMSLKSKFVHFDGNKSATHFVSLLNERRWLIVRGKLCVAVGTVWCRNTARWCLGPRGGF
jgi:hypothetical protein